MYFQVETRDKPLGVWAIIPARGGSVGIPRKNLISCAGKPLIQHVLETAKMVLTADRIVVITDSSEIADFARLQKVHVVLEEEPSGPNETLDEKLLRNLSKLIDLGAVPTDIILTLQATSPLTRATTILSAVAELEAGNKSVITVTNDPHLRWAIDTRNGEPTPQFSARKNRQQLPPDYRETGGIVGVRLADLASEKTRIVNPVGLVIVEDEEAIDIDSFGHLLEAQHFLTKSKVLFRVDANRSLGMGHLYRCLAVAYELSRHDIVFLTTNQSPLVEKVIQPTPFRVLSFADEKALNEAVREFEPDLVFLDILDTDIETVNALRKSAPRARIVTFENNGSGAALCDLGVYDLTHPPKDAPIETLTGPNYAILGPSFELFQSVGEEESRPRALLLTFGGTDPAGLTQKAIEALNHIEYQGEVTAVLGLGAPEPVVHNLRFSLQTYRNVSNMALLMGRHSLAISSMGRTVFELAASGVPSLTFSQNEKEDQHVHVGNITGSLNGGRGYAMSAIEMSGVIEAFLADHSSLERARVETSLYRAKRSNPETVRDILYRIGLSQLIFR